MKPVVDGGYLSDSADLATLREGLRMGRRMGKQMGEYTGEEVYPGKDVETDDQLDDYIRNTLHTANALVGTCKMGTPTDKTAVVDASLKLLGVSGVRVVDASVMPRIPGGQVGTPCVMIAEKAADILRRGE